MMVLIDDLIWSLTYCGCPWLDKESLEEFGVLEPLRMALGKKEDEGTHTYMIVIGHLDTYYTLNELHGNTNNLNP